MALLTVSVLGPLLVTRDTGPVNDFGYNKVRGLLVYLAVEAGQPHQRAHLGSLLWPDQPDRGSRRNLSQALTQLRRILGGTGASEASGPLLNSSLETVQLNPAAAVEVDAAQFISLLAASERHAHRSWHTCAACAERLQAALKLYRGDFLAGFSVPDSAPFEEWALIWRERMRQRALSALERLARWAEWRGAFGQAAAYAWRQVELDSLNEAAHRAAMRLLALNGELAAAGAQYEQLRRMLADELAVAPESETVALHDRIRAGALDGLRRFRPPPFNGPHAPNSLIGRAEAVAAVSEHLRADQARALTLTGSPGIGKTRLALQAASDLRFDFEDGVHVVELALVADPAAVPTAIAQALEVKEQAGKPLADTLKAHLRSRHCLLVLDNCEHVLEAAGFVAELLAACSAVKVLATSRTPLRIRAEVTYAVAALHPADAQRLFVERGSVDRPGQPASPQTQAAIAEICRRLDCLPLAIELIAVRARALSPAELLRQLDQPLSAPASAPRDLPERHRTLRSALAWSYDRLTTGEQLVFRRLGVFTGGGTLEAAQAVVGETRPVLPRLEALHEASLVQTHTVADATRFTLLETLREFALEQLAALGEADAAHRRHAAYCLALAERAEPELLGPRQKQWFDRLEREWANLTAALAWSAAQAPEMGLRLATALADFWRVRGHLKDGQRWLAAGLRQSESAPLGVRARGLLAAGRLARVAGSHLEARTLLTQAQQLFLRTEDTQGLAMVFYTLGMATMGLAEHAAAQAHFEQSLSLAREIDDWYTEAGALNGLARLAARQGNYPLSQALSQQAFAIDEANQDWRNVAGLKLNLGLNAYDQGNFAASLQSIEAALAMARELDDHDLVALSLVGLGNTLIALGELPRARAQLEETITRQRARGDSERLASPLDALGRALHQMGQYAAARAHLAEALTLRQAGGDRRGVAVTLENLARLDHSEQRPDRAARLLGAAAAIRDAIGAPHTPAVQAEHAQTVAAVRATLGAAAFEKAWAAGRALTPEEALTLALDN